MSDSTGPLIVAVAPNGAYKSKADHPGLPLSPRELAKTAAACVEAGAAMIHLHVRDKDGRHSLDAGHYREAIASIKSGHIPDTPHWILYVLGRYSEGLQSHPDQLLPLLAQDQQICVPWAVCAFGKTELACVTAAALHGGHARVGFENNFYRADGGVAIDNAKQIEQLVNVVRFLDILLASADEFRASFNGWG